MKITKRQLRRIIKEELNKIRKLNEYGGTHGSVSWYEHDDEEILFDIEGEGEELNQDEVEEILNSPYTDDKTVNDIQAALKDLNDYRSGY